MSSKVQKGRKNGYQKAERGYLGAERGKNERDYSKGTSKTDGGGQKGAKTEGGGEQPYANSGVKLVGGTASITSGYRGQDKSSINIIQSLAHGTKKPPLGK